ncbi:MAG: hypothetical protein JW983_03960 [Elusimicrobia bacterium]|nr:hypothetical protein [Elusimicrobiota bacterium]
MKNYKLPILFSALVLLFFGRVIFTDKIFYFRDILNLFLPYRLFAAENIQSGILPLWNPYTFFGQPFLANPETSLFYPFTVLFYIFKFSIAYKLFIVLHFFTAMILFYFAARLLKAKNSYAILASVAWAFGGYLTARIEFLSILGAAVWLPLVLILLIRNKKLLLGIVFTFQILAGHPQIIFYSVILLLFFLNKQRLQTLIYSLVFAALLSAIQLIPFGEFVKNSNRADGLTYEEASSVSVKPYEVFRNLLPKSDADITGRYWLKSSYIGFVPLIFVLIYLFKNNKKLVLPLIVVIILALGRNTPVYLFLYKYLLPFSRIRYPAAIIFLYTFILCLMASQINLPTNGQSAPHTNKLVRGSIGGGVNIGKIGRLMPLILIFTLGDLFFNSYKLNPTIPSKLLNIKTQNIFELQQRSDNKKYLVLKDAYSKNQNYYNFINTLPANINIPYHIYNAGGYDPLTTKGIENFAEKLSGNPDAGELAKYDIKYIITGSPPRQDHWEKITKNLFENKLCYKKEVINPQTFHPRYFYFLLGLYITVFSIILLFKQIIIRIQESV